MSGTIDPNAARRAELVARAGREREEMAVLLAPLGTLDRGLETLAAAGERVPAFVASAGLGLSALLLALPTGRSSFVRRGVATLQLAGSLARLLLRRR